MKWPTFRRELAQCPSTFLGTALFAAAFLAAAILAAPFPILAQDSDKDEGLPLPSDRTLAIDMTEGSWISLDVSPDGATIVFDHLGDLFTVPITGGDATRITSGMAFDAQPRFSPDGTRIVFTSDRSGGQNVWVMSLDGSDTTQITKGATNRSESPDWAPDGDYIVSSKGGFRGGGLPKLWLHHVDGGSGVELISEPENLKTLGAAFDPTGRYIWHARRTGDWTYNAQLPQYQLAVYDRDTGDTYTRTSRYGSGVRPTLSPDGRWLVYGTRHDDRTGLLIRDLESGAERWLAYPVQHDDQESRATLDVLPGMSFTPDSRHLVASYGGRIWKLDLEGGAEEIPFRVNYDLALGPVVDFDYPIEDTQTFTVRQIRDGVPSPDGSRIAFTALDRLWVAGADGSDPRRLTESDMSEHFPAWSPSGDWVAYSTWDGEGGHLYKTRADGGGSPVQLTAMAAVYVTPAWSPAGNRVVALRSYARDFVESAAGFGSGAPQPAEIVWVADADGPGTATVIAPVDGRRGPHFAAGGGGNGGDADRIYLHKGQDILVSIRWDGTDEREHVRVRGSTPPGTQNALTPSVLRMAPAGDQVMALIEGQIYTTTVPMVGGEAPLINVGNPDNAAVPARRLTEMGGEFPAWATSGRAVHWSLGRAFFTYDLDEAEAFEEAREAEEREEAEEAEDEEEAEEAEEAGDAEEEEVDEEGDDDEDDDSYQPAEVRIDIQAERDIPSGTALLSGARVITVADAGVIERADILVRRQPHRRRGPRRLARCARRRTRHRHVRQDHRPRLRRHARPHAARAQPAPLRRLAVPGEPRVRRHDHPRPPDRHHRCARLFGPRAHRRTGRTPRVFDRPRRLLAAHDRLGGEGEGYPLQVRQLLRHQDDQDVRRGQSPAAPVDHHGGARAGADAHHRGVAQHQAEPERNHRRVSGLGALDPHLSGL